MTMRIALLSSANGWRGSGASYAKIARGLAERGHVARLVTAVPRLTARLRAMALPVSEIPGRNTGVREVLALHRVLREHRIDAVVADTPRDVRLAAYATLLRPGRVIYRYNLNYRRARTDLMDRIYLSRVAACIYQSRWIELEAAAQDPLMRRRRGYRIPNGYDTTQYAPRPEEGRRFRRDAGVPDDAFVVVTLAKLTRNKGQEVAIEALARLRAAGTGVTYVICGDGGREDELRALARARGIPVIFTGLLAVQDIVAALSAADVVVHPSLKEIFPNAVGEAMACGRAVIAADAGGTAELLGDDGTAGVLVPPGDPLVLADAIGALFADPARRARLGAAARERIERYFPLARMIDGYEQVLHDVLKPSAAGNTST